jgi:hypothetical protein
MGMLALTRTVVQYYGQFGGPYIYSRFGLTKLLASAEIAAISDASSLWAFSVTSSTE